MKDSKWQQTQRKYKGLYELLYANKLHHLKEMSNFLETYNLQQKENLNRPIPTNEINVVVQKLETNTSPGPDGFTV